MALFIVFWPLLMNVVCIFHQVTKVSDVVSIGQQVSLKCIEQDNRGNIKLSLKATIPPPRTKASKVVKGSVASNEQEKLQSVVEDIAVDVNKASGPTSSSSPSAFLIRSTAECEEEEKSAGINVSSKSNPSEPPSVANSTASTVYSPSDLNDNEAKVEGPISAKKLKLGMKAMAKVHQIRAHGLVLNLGGGIRGMYRFEVCFTFNLYSFRLKLRVPL